MRRDIGPDGNDIFENDTIGGVPAFTYMKIASRLRYSERQKAYGP